MNNNHNMQEIADMAAVCKMIGTVATSHFDFQQLLFVNLELHCQQLSKMADGHQFYVGDLSLFEFASIHAETLDQFTASQQNSTCVPALNSAEGQLVCKSYPKLSDADASAIRIELSTKTGDNSK